jgi:threonine/homoserine/homoserine lactone efflux protein
MEIVFNGFLSGIVLSILIGPVFFTILQTSIERGFWSGFLVAVGVSLSDAVYISLCYLGVYQLLIGENAMKYLGYFGGVVLLLFGIYYLLIKSRKLKQDHAVAEQSHNPYRHPYRLILKGFIINGLSPTVLMFWLGTIGFATTNFGYEEPFEAIPYFAAIVTTVFITDILKAKLADKLRVVLTPVFIRTLNIIVGLVMVIFGGKLIALADTLTPY